MRPLLLLVLLVFAVPAFAHEAEAPRYLNPEFLSPELLLPPAKENTAAWNTQITMVAKTQKHIRQEDKADMLSEQKASVEMVSNALGSGFDAQHYPKTFELLHHAFSDTASVTEKAKQYWGTSRPYIAEPKKIKLLVDPITNNAYPSGHTSISYVLAEILGILIPEKRMELRERAAQIALHRIMAGVHYPQDIQAGGKLGAMILGAILQNSDFQDDLAEAKEELAEHGK